LQLEGEKTNPGYAQKSIIGSPHPLNEDPGEASSEYEERGKQDEGNICNDYGGNARLGGLL
jgi:hypothetical protein